MLAIVKLLAAIAAAIPAVEKLLSRFADEWRKSKAAGNKSEKDKAVEDAFNGIKK